jgi:uncharacterized membrane protein
MTRMTPKRFLTLFLGYFFKGVLYTVPIFIIIYAIVSLFFYIDGLMPVEIPGLGIVVLIVIITLAGYFGATLLGGWINRVFNRLLNRAPLLKTIYSSIADLLSSFVGKKRAFKRPVLVKLNKGSDIERLGFVTNESLAELGIAPGKIAVYIPLSYSFSGDLFIVPTENVTHIDGKPAEVMKFIVSGGVSDFENPSTAPKEPKDVPASEEEASDARPV